MMPSKFCIHYVSKSGRLSSCHRTGKGQISSQFPRRVVLKNVLIIRQLHSSPMLVRSCLKSYVLVFSIMQNQKLLDVQAEFRKGRGIREQIANIRWIIEKGREFQKNIYLCFIGSTFLLMSMLEDFSVPFYTLVKLCYTKVLE